MYSLHCLREEYNTLDVVYRVLEYSTAQPLSNLQRCNSGVQRRDENGALLVAVAMVHLKPTLLKFRNIDFLGKIIVDIDSSYSSCLCLA